MAFVRGFDRNANGALVTSSAAPATNSAKVLGWAVNSAGAAHRVNGDTGLPAGAVIIRGRAYSAAGAVVIVTTAPSDANSKFIHGIRHHINGAMFAKSAAPGVTARRSSHERLLFDPADGGVFFDSVA